MVEVMTAVIGTDDLIAGHGNGRPLDLDIGIKEMISKENISSSMRPLR